MQVEAEGVDKYLVTTNTITAQEIAERGYRDLADILSQVPGLYMVPADKNSKMVRIRGAEVGQTKVYIDGIPAFPLNGIASNAAADLSTIPADSIAKVEIIKGPGPVQYGTDYKGGVILVTTKDGEGAGKFRLSIAGGAHHTYDTRIGYSGSDKNISYALKASKRHTGDYLPNSENDKLYFDGNIKFKTSDTSALTLSGYYSDMDSEISNSVDPITGKTLTANINWSLAQSVPNSVRRNNRPIIGITKASNRRISRFKTRVAQAINGSMMSNTIISLTRTTSGCITFPQAKAGASQATAMRLPNGIAAVGFPQETASKQMLQQHLEQSIN